MTLLFAFIVWLGPSWILIYNREYRKGVLCIGLNVLLIYAFSAWLGKALRPYLPVDFNPRDGAAFTALIQKHVVADHPVTFYIYEGLLGGLWVYTVVSAVLGLIRRRRRARARDRGVPPGRD